MMHQANLSPTTPSADATMVEVLRSHTPEAAAQWFAAMPHSTVTTLITDLSTDDLYTLATTLTPENARTLLTVFGPEATASRLHALSPRECAELVVTLDTDVAAQTLRRLAMDSEEFVDDLLSALPVATSAVLSRVLSWPAECAGAWMRPEAIKIPVHSSVGTAAEACRQAPSTFNEGIFIVDSDMHLVGWLAPATLITSPDRTPVEDVMVDAATVRTWSTKPLSDQEQATELAHRSPTGTVPVLDADHVLGVITRNSITRIHESELREDNALQGGASPLEVSYRQASIKQLWRVRIVWLALLFLAEMYTGTVLRHFQDELEAVVALAFFIPLLIGTGGNIGTQITTTLIRAMSTESLRLHDMGRVLPKELGAGLLLGLAMGLLGAIRAWSLGVVQPVILTVAIALVCICLWSSLIASFLPLLLKRFGADPAVVSGPMISTIVDGTGLVIYFTVARLIILGN
ncbi:Magnesium transporter mgtE [Corynebacterium pseudotuberculosis]|nr:magnesium transporter [Corynebacterium pseudotuberculosis]ANH22834.1 Magnesium transporter mgtE [Corynebacterium pseudotuberculosis]